MSSELFYLYKLDKSIHHFEKGLTADFNHFYINRCKFNANSEDPNQTPLVAASDLCRP